MYIKLFWKGGFIDQQSSLASSSSGTFDDRRFISFCTLVQPAYTHRKKARTVSLYKRGNPVHLLINTGPPYLKKLDRIFSNRGSLKSGGSKIGSPGKSFKIKK